MPQELVHHLRDSCSGAAAHFAQMREAKRENTRCGLRPMSDKAAGQKTRSPKGCDENGPAAALLLSHVSIQICSFVAPCWRPILIATPLPQSLTWCTRATRNLLGPLKLDRPLVRATVASSEILRLESLLWLLESHPVPRLIDR